MSSSSRTRSTATPSGVPGLIVGGKPPFMQLIHEGTGKSICGATTGHPFGRSVNSFRLVRDAKAAAQRVASIMPWERDDLDDWLRSLPVMEHAALGRRITEALAARDA